MNINSHFRCSISTIALLRNVVDIPDTD